jgi:hypothetical protein
MSAVEKQHITNTILILGHMEAEAVAHLSLTTN